MKKKISLFSEAKKNGQKISVLTAYDYSTAKIMDDAGIDVVLVGDSLGNVILGYENTLRVTMEDMIHHAKAVVRGCQKAFVVVDMPFMSYQTSVYDAVSNAGRLIKQTGAQAVKLEGGETMCMQIEALKKASIPVMAHIGLTPQSVNALGGYYVQGKSEESARKLVDDAKAVEQAGAFALVLECVPDELARHVTKELSIPTIGIGAGNGCDGQVLVGQDMFGMGVGLSPKFVKQYASIGEIMKHAVQEYCHDVQTGQFPAPEQTYHMSADVIKKLY